MAGEKSNNDQGRTSHECCVSKTTRAEVSRRGFLGALGALAAAGQWTAAAPSASAAADGPAAPGQPLPQGRALRVQPVLMVHLDQPRDPRNTGGKRMI